MTSTIGIIEHPETTEKLNRRGMVMVLSSPSGGGKTTISRKILEMEDNVVVSISATTRPKRDNEVDGEDYFFVDEEKFQEMVANDEFLEYVTADEHYIGYSYGTPKAAVEKALADGKDILLDIEAKGTRQVDAAMPKDVVTIFILPPSWAELETRLKNRDVGDEEEAARRMTRAGIELSYYGDYYYIVVNHDVEDSVRRVQAILEAERMRRSRLEGLPDFVAELQPAGETDKVTNG